MLFARKTVLAILAQAFVALAQTNNSFNVPQAGYNSVAGQSLALTWTPTSPGTVSLILRSGAASALNPGTVIARNITNSGSYTWNLPSDITRNSDYAIEIVSDTDPSITNYTPYFVIDSTNTIASSTNGISGSSLATATATSSGASASGSSAISSVSSRASSASASASASGSSAASSASSAASSGASSARSSVSSAASSAASAVSSAASRASTGGAAMATAFPGLMGVLAVGALVL